MRFHSLVTAGLVAIVLPACLAESESLEPAEHLGASSQAFTASDGRSFDLVFKGVNGGLRVDPLGPIATTCLTTAGEAGCPITRLDFHNANLTLDQQKSVLDRVAASSFDEARTSILFKGTVITVTVHDHRSGTDVTYTELRYAVDRVYVAAAERTHVKTFWYLYTTSNPYQEALRTGVAAKYIPGTVAVTWATGLTGPAGLIDDGIVSGDISPPPDPQHPATLRADQYFARLLP